MPTTPTPRPWTLRWLACALCASLTLLSACADDEPTGNADATQDASADASSDTSGATSADTSGSTNGDASTSGDTSGSTSGTTEDTSGSTSGTTEDTVEDTVEDTSDPDTVEDTSDPDTVEDTSDPDTVEDTTDPDTAEDTSDPDGDTSGGTIPTVQADCAEASLTSCFTNYDCGDSDASRCQDIGETDPVACCVPAPRGAGAAGDPCTDENDCRSGICFSYFDGSPSLCSDRCNDAAPCPANIEVCDVVPFVSEGPTDTWCQKP